MVKDGTQREISPAGRSDREKERRGKVMLPPLFPPPMSQPFLRHETAAPTGSGGPKRSRTAGDGTSQEMEPAPPLLHPSVLCSS